MSDYLGLNQTRVLDSTNRNFESLIYQKQKPPLSSEVNLTGKIDAERDQQNVQAMLPSGWVSVGQIRDNVLASACKTGDVLCSPDLSNVYPYFSNAFKFIAQDLGLNTEKNIAWVNGWRIVVQGGSSPHNDDDGYDPWSNATEDCLITLPAPPAAGSRLDFVFLEVWRKLVTPDDNIYQYGNVDHPAPFTNDLIDPARGFETSLRVQIQYRIRVATVDDIDLHPEGFCDSVHVQGPLPHPITYCDHATFSPVPGDPGLWRAGAGDSVAQDTLDTVDGYTYAIPMFVIRRRNTEAYDPRVTSNGCLRSLIDYKNGLPSDRPDDLYYDWIVAEDFVDLRHKVSTDANISNICSNSFRALQANTLQTKMGTSTQGGENHGVSRIQVDSINVGNTWSNLLGYSNEFRRVFSNAVRTETFYIYKTVNDKTVNAGNSWAIFDEFTVDLADILPFPYVYPSNVTIVSIASGTYPYGLGGVNVRLQTSSNTGTLLTLMIPGPGLPIIGTTTPLVIPITVSYAANSEGLSEVPTEFLEARKVEGYPTTMYPIAMKDRDIRVRYDAAALPVSTTDQSNQYNMLRARGGNTYHSYDFGHQMIYHVTGNGTNFIQFQTPISGYDIIGVANIKADNTATIPNPSITITNDATYVINLGQNLASGKDAELTLYTGDKYFEGNKQGRSIYDCYQMVNLPAVGTPNGSKTDFYLDILHLAADSSTTGDAFLALGSYADKDGSGQAYVTLSGTTSVYPLVTNNRDLPDATTYQRVDFVTAPPTGSTVEVPVLLRTAVGISEAYSFFYKYKTYQGLLDTTTTPVTGAIECVGNAITTSAGSGAIVDASYSTGLITFNSTTLVTGIGTSWLELVDSETGLLKAPYVIASTDPSSEDYRAFIIDSIVSDTQLYITTEAPRTSSLNEEYVITALDQPKSAYSNIVDRLPSLSDLDHLGINEPISFINTDLDTCLDTRAVSRVQDVADVPVNTALIGTNYAYRGMSTVNLPTAKLGRSNLGLKFEKMDSLSAYKKTYQSYILNKDNSGRLYLMVVGSETDTTGTDKCFLNERSNSDSVDIFEIPGRPLIANRDK